MEEQSPLSQLARPQKLQPKIIELYQTLIRDDHLENAEGFWREFFLLRPDREGFEQTVGKLSADALLQHQTATQQLFRRAVQAVKAGSAPSDENALDTLTAFLEVALQKRFNSPSSDIITIIGSLDEIDTVFTDFVAVLEATLRDGRTLDVRQKATRTAIAAVAGAYRTSLVSYFINKDIFPALMKLIQDSDHRLRMFGPFTLLGMLANYNKFEFQNPYGLRLEDFVNDEVIRKTATATCETLEALRDEYIDIQNDATESWSIGNTLSYLGFSALGGNKNTNANSNEEDVKAAFAAMPPDECAILLTTYDFAHANKLFSTAIADAKPTGDGQESNISRFLSLSSYLFQNAHRSPRATQYACLALITIRILIEDVSLARLLANEDLKVTTRLCRQRQPYLPPVKEPRVPLAVVLDVVIDGLNHNLRRRLDVELYSLFLDIVLRVISFLSHSRIRMSYHWSELWRCLLSFVRFLNSYASSLQNALGMDSLTDTVCNILAFSLTTGEAFLPDAKSYDDLFYKVFESGEQLQKYRNTYEITKRPSAGAIEILTGVAGHFNALLEEQTAKGSKNLSPRDVTKVIRQGYDSLPLQSKDNLDRWIIYREVDYRNLLKKVTRVAVQDIKSLLAARTEL